MSNEIKNTIDHLMKVIQLQSNDTIYINELIENYEWGVALETICGIILEDKININIETYNEIQGLGSKMEMNPVTWESIKGQIS